MTRFRILLALLVFLLVIVTGSAQAQSGLVFESVQIQFWPEYDQPSMLVIYSLELPVDQVLPVEFSVRIPARVGEPTAVAVLDGNSLVTNEYTRTEIGDWAEISLVSDSTFIQIEYYDPALSQADQPRNYQLDWDFDYQINDLVISFKEPLNASNVQLQPDLGTAAVAGDGLNTYTSSLGVLPAGANIDFEVSYQKSDTVLAAQAPVQPSTSQQAEPSSSVGFQSDVPAWGWALVGAGIVILLGGTIYLIRSRQGNATQSRYRQKKQRSGGDPGKGVFCHECGVKARTGDKFCRECGTRLRL